jgi:hypothetical protein
MPFALTMVAKRLKTPWQLIRLATKMVRSRNTTEIAATRYAISVAMALDHLDDMRIELNHALKSNRIPIEDVLTDIYDIEDAMRVRIDRTTETDWGRKLASIMAAVASDLQAEFQTLPGNLHHVLGSDSLHRHHAEPALLSSPDGPVGVLKPCCTMAADRIKALTTPTGSSLPLQLPLVRLSESMGDHDSNILDAGSVD